MNVLAIKTSAFDFENILLLEFKTMNVLAIKTSAFDFENILRLRYI